MAGDNISSPSHGAELVTGKWLASQQSAGRERERENDFQIMRFCLNYLGTELPDSLLIACDISMRCPTANTAIGNVVNTKLKALLPFLLLTQQLRVHSTGDLITFKHTFHIRPYSNDCMHLFLF